MERTEGTIVGVDGIGVTIRVDLGNANGSGFHTWYEVTASLRGSLKVGDRVRMEYIATPSSGLWGIVERIERIDPEVAMFGTTRQAMAIDLDLQRRVYQNPVATERHPRTSGWGMLAMAILSDAQEVMARGDVETARQFVNKAKWVIADRVKAAGF